MYFVPIGLSILLLLAIIAVIYRHHHDLQEHPDCALNVVAKDHSHEKKITPPEEAAQWLPLVHSVIGNLKTFLNGTFHGVTHK
jgi:hypothetical protein